MGACKRAGEGLLRSVCERVEIAKVNLNVFGFLDLDMVVEFVFRSRKKTH